MNYKILGDNDCPLIEISLNNNESVKIENGAMAYMSNVVIEGKLNSKKSGFGGLLSAIGRSLTSGESMFITQATGESDDAFIGIAPALPGKIISLQVQGNKQYRLNTAAYIASDMSVDYVMKKQDLGKALFSGTGGLFVMETEGDGEILVSAFGSLLELEVTPDRPLKIDNEHVVAWDAALDYHLEIASGTFGFTTGEGIVNTFTGQGKVLIQTRNIHSLADAIRVFIPTQSSSN